MTSSVDLQTITVFSRARYQIQVSQPSSRVAKPITSGLAEDKEREGLPLADIV